MSFYSFKIRQAHRQHWRCALSNRRAIEFFQAQTSGSQDFANSCHNSISVTDHRNMCRLCSEGSKGNGPRARYVKLRVARALGMPGTFSPPPWVIDPYMYHGTCVTHVPWCMPGSLTNSFLWSRWRGKRSRHSRRMRNPQFYVSGKRPMASNMESEIRGIPLATELRGSHAKDRTMGLYMDMINRQRSI